MPNLKEPLETEDTFEMSDEEFDELFTEAFEQYERGEYSDIDTVFNRLEARIDDRIKQEVILNISKKKAIA